MGTLIKCVCSACVRTVRPCRCPVVRTRRWRVPVHDALTVPAATHAPQRTLKTRMNESMVSLVSRRYMRVVSGKERLMVCLSEFLKTGGTGPLISANYTRPITPGTSGEDTP